VLPGNARGTRVQIKVRIVVKAADARIADLVNQVAMPQCEIAAARPMRSLDNRDLIAFASKLIGCCETRNGGPQYDDGAISGTRGG
jgi:hypothetical protein